MFYLSNTLGRILRLLFRFTKRIRLFKSVFKLTCYTYPLKRALKVINLKKGVRSLFQEKKTKGRLKEPQEIGRQCAIKRIVRTYTGVFTQVMVSNKLS